MTALPPAVAAYRKAATALRAIYRPPAPRIRLTPGAVILAGFARHQISVAGLPRSEQSTLQTLAAGIAEAHRSSEPVRIVQVIGHADADPRGPRFEKQVSRQRAEAVRAFLERRVQARGEPGRITWTAQGAGATRPVVRQPRSEADRRRNRRVEVNLVAPRVIRSAGLASRRGRLARAATGPITVSAPRTCCLLIPTPYPSAISSDSNLADPSDLGTHNTRSEKVGLIYSGLLGFMDLGHIRDLCDLTHVVYRHIEAGRGAPTTITTLYGQATVTTPIPRNMWLPVAQSIAYDDGFGHEVLSYDEMVPGEHNSSFSPEDLCSNKLGRRIGAIALRSPDPFDQGVTQALASQVFAAGGVSKSETLQAFSKINHCWVEFKDWTSGLDNDYLRRRNFSVWPWKVPGMRNHPTPSYVGQSFAAAEPFYSYEAIGHRGRLGSRTVVRIQKPQFPAELSRIRQDAARRYGPSFDQPSCS